MNPEEHPIRSAAAILSASLATAAAAQTPGFWLVGMPPEATGGGVSSLSQDGSVAGGATGWQTTSLPIVQYAPGYTWTAAGGRHDFGLEPGMPQGSAVQAMNSDGQVLVGWMHGGGPPRRSFRRVGAGPLQDLGTAGWANSEALGVSGDGGTVVGWNHGGSGFGQAFRWTETGGMQPLGYLRPNGSRSQAFGISRDGTTIVGESQSDGFSGPVEAFVWREGTGMQALPGLPGAWVNENSARATNTDGSVIVGMGAAISRTHAIRWVNGVPEDLGLLPGYLDSVAWAMNDDGSVIAGACTGVPTTTGFVWTEVSGLQSISAYLAAHGVALPPNYLLQDVYAVSGDGLTFGGAALNLSTNQPEGFVATIPAPSALIVVSVPALVLAKRRRRGG